MDCTVKWTGEGMSFVAETGSNHALIMDGAPEAGGRNLAPRPMMKGKYVSEGMIFAADTDVDGGCSIAFFPDNTPAGARIH